MKQSLRGATASQANSTRALTVLALAGTTAAMLVAAAPTSLHAQQPAAGAAPACEIDQNSPSALALATLSVAKAGSAPAAADKAKNLRDAVKRVTDNADKLGNPAGRNFVLAQALYKFAELPGYDVPTKRSALGYSQNPEGMIDPIAAADTAIRAATAAAPNCAKALSEMRMNQAWLNTTNAALGALNAGQLDSAKTLASRSLLMYSESPYAYHILSTVAQQKNDIPTAAGYWTKTIELAGNDTTFRDVKRAAMYNLGAAEVDQAQSAKGAEQKAHAQAAVKTMRGFLTEYGTIPEAASVLASTSQMMKLAGDSASIPSLYADMLAKPTNYSDMMLSQAGVVAAQSSHAADATRLFDAALAANPYSRDALANLALMYGAQGDFDKMLGVTQRLVAMDPSNPDNVLNYVYAYSGLRKAAKTPALQKALTDSALKYQAMVDKAPAKIVFTEITRGSQETAVGATITNLSATPKSYDLKIDFVDKAGTVVGSQTASTGSLAKGASKSLRLTIPKGGVAGFKYSELK